MNDAGSPKMTDRANSTAALLRATKLTDPDAIRVAHQSRKG